MKKNVKNLLVAAVLVLAANSAAQAALLTSSGYTQNFDAMGTTTLLPTDWTVWSIAGTHSDWTTSIATTGTVNMKGGTQVTTGSALVDTSITASTKSATTYYNVAAASTPTNRGLATSPTGNAGNVIQLSLTNNTGGALNSLNISYDLIKYADGQGQGSTPYKDELPGYQLFYSLDNGATYTNVTVLNPVSTADGIHPVVAPRADQTSTTFHLAYSLTSIGSTQVGLSSALANGSNILLRWVDDNGVTLSPDQFVALDNVTVSAAPTPVPAAAWLLGSGLMGLVGLRRKDRG